jgi:hypothetical protein
MNNELEKMLNERQWHILRHYLRVCLRRLTKTTKYYRFWTLTAEVTKVTVFWVVAPRSGKIAWKHLRASISGKTFIFVQQI